MKTWLSLLFGPLIETHFLCHFLHRLDVLLNQYSKKPNLDGIMVIAHTINTYAARWPHLFLKKEGCKFVIKISGRSCKIRPPSPNFHTFLSIDLFVFKIHKTKMLIIAKNFNVFVEVSKKSKY